MRLLILSVLLAAACGSSKICNDKTTGNGPACEPGTTVDTTAKACSDDSGAQFICHNGSGYCVVCIGAEFNEGCTPNNSGVQSYCVHSCSDC